MTLWVFVDCDGTLVDKDDHPRPRVVEFFTRLKRFGCTTVVWSAGGEGYAKSKFSMIANHAWYEWNIDMSPLVHTFLWKKGLEELAVVLKDPQFYIDDSQELLDAMKEKGHGVFKVPFYESSTNLDDRWLLKASDAVERYLHVDLSH